MFEKFTEQAKRSITLAQDEAMTLGHDFIGTEHILLGLVHVGDGVAGTVLSEHEVTVPRAFPKPPMLTQRRHWRRSALTSANPAARRRVIRPRPISISASGVHTSRQADARAVP